MRSPGLTTALLFAGATFGCTTTPDDHDDLSCGAGTTAIDGVCVADDDVDVTCGEGTERVGDACVAIADTDVAPPLPLEGGTYASPLVLLKRLQGVEDHMHISEVKYRDEDGLLFSCSYSFDVIDASNPQRMEFLVQGLDHDVPVQQRRTPGCNHLALDAANPNIVYTTHRKNIDFATFLSSWDLQPDPEDDEVLVATQGPALQEEGVSYEGITFANGLLYAAIHEGGLAIYDPGEDRSFTRVGTLTQLDNAWDVIVHGTTAYVADGLAGIVTVDVSDPTTPVVLGRVSTLGQARDLILDGTTLYVAAGAAGLAVVDVSNLAAPTLVTTVDTPGTAAGLDFERGRVYLASWGDTRIFDVSTPASPRFLAAVRNTLQQTYGTDGGLRPDITARTFAVAAKDDFVFVGNWWVPYAYQLHADNLAPYMVLPELVNNIGFGPVEVGASKTTTFDIENHGTAPLTVFDLWTDNPSFEVMPAEVEIPIGGTATITVTYTAATTDLETSLLHMRSDDPQQPLRQAWLTGNQPGLGVGTPLPETVADLIDGGGTWTSTDHTGKVMLINFFATFCPVCGTEMPDMELQFWQAYKDEDVEIVAIDPNNSDTIGGVEEFCYNMGLTFPVGLEVTDTYGALQANYDGANPYPTNLLVDKQGIIRYVAVEYDPDTMLQTLDMLLAE